LSATLKTTHCIAMACILLKYLLGAMPNATVWQTARNGF
jgi:hypothetical protein